MRTTCMTSWLPMKASPCFKAIRKRGRSISPGIGNANPSDPAPFKAKPYTAVFLRPGTRLDHRVRGRRSFRHLNLFSGGSSLRLWAALDGPHLFSADGFAAAHVQPFGYGDGTRACGRGPAALLEVGALERLYVAPGRQRN